VGRDDVYLEISPLEENYQDLVNILVCRNVTQIPSEDTNNSKHSDNLLKSLRKYYAEVKTKSQLSLNVLAGFHQANMTQKNFQEFMPPHYTKSRNFVFVLRSY
jgi:hypothetical protein